MSVAVNEPALAAGASAGEVEMSGGARLVRIFGWAVLGCLAVFLINNYLTFWQDWPGAAAPLAAGSGPVVPLTGWLQLFAYPLAAGIAVAYVLASSDKSMRADSQSISRINTFLIRAAFFAVVYVGLADAVFSFLRVEGFLPGLFGESFATEISRAQYRGPVVHMPLIALGILTAMVTRTLGFHWLALLIVIAELTIVITRFIFSYEQAFMADLVRFWYAALFLFASAYTLIEEGHVRVDVFYTTFSRRTKGYVNAIGSVLLGMSLCWVILWVGMGTKSSIINSPILAFETTQTGFGMYVKYLMAAFLGIFAISMMIQFVSYMMDAVADIRDEPGGRDHDAHVVQ